uniref:Uncharacterized protein n=1 Tax=Mucochytrium quahogii TaxID=96639 RepID=A0A7S2WHA4_9STRA|mmetsp:Transcript_23829/g.51820  ORF Transcript_23829/g.51820 Transcript_23829/m.51820 type:complete len:616 (+) Transcript_23829:407-2254(+)
MAGIISCRKVLQPRVVLVLLLVLSLALFNLEIGARVQSVSRTSSALRRWKMMALVSSENTEVQQLDNGKVEISNNPDMEVSDNADKVEFSSNTDIEISNNDTNGNGILCFVIAHSSKLGGDPSKVDHVLDTWGKRCGGFVLVEACTKGRCKGGESYTSVNGNHAKVVTIKTNNICMSGKKYPSLLNLENTWYEGYSWPLVWKAWKRLSELDDFKSYNWFVKADLSSFVFPDNIAEYVKYRNFNYNSNDAYYIHEKTTSFVSILSRGAVELWVNSGLVVNKPKCKLSTRACVVETETTCMESAMEALGESLNGTLAFDGRGKDMFILLNGNALRNESGSWVYRPEVDEKLNSNKPLALEYVSPKAQVELEGFLYGNTGGTKFSNYFKTIRESLDKPYESLKDLLANLEPIPHRVHISWKDPLLVEHLPNHKYVQSIKNMGLLNDGWDVKVTGDPSINGELQEFFSPEEWEEIKDRPFIEKLDLWRLVKIYSLGGFYQDIDRLYNVPFSDALDKDERLRCVLPMHYRTNFAQNVMFCAQSSPFHKLAIDLNMKLRRMGENQVLALGPGAYWRAITRILVHDEFPQKRHISELIKAGNQVPYLSVIVEDEKNRVILQA